jgi:RNA polymerase sigma-70 factor (ECF subfamily)
MATSWAIEDIHRREWPRVVATVARSFGLDVAEDAAAEAFATALTRWPVDGLPDNPGAWLTTAARRKALDHARRERGRGNRQSEAQARLIDRLEQAPPRHDGSVVDDQLRLVFTCCHPALAPEAQIALTLRLIAGLTTNEIARAFLVSDSTMARRLHRAKEKIRRAGIPYRVPPRDELPDRLAGVLRVVYLVFREGYSPTAGDALVRADLRDEAKRLARLLNDLLPDDGEVLGLLALLLLHDSRRATRVDSAGDLVLLADQDRAQWDRAAITEGIALATRALARGRRTYALQAGLAACHAGARSSDETDWNAIARLYAELASLDRSPAVAMNRAVAVAEVDGAAAGFAMLESLASTADGARLAATSHLLHGARADLLRRLDRPADAAAAYRRAIDLAGTTAERRFYERRMRSL